MTAPNLNSSRAVNASAAAGLSVKGTDPAYGRRGDVGLRVTIEGSGFAPGATASWALNGSPSASIVVKSTEYVSTTKLIATIDIASTAELDLFDVTVVSTGRKGIGTESSTAPDVFQVTGTDSQANWMFYPTLSDNTTPTRLHEDGLGEYVGGQCGVRATISWYQTSPPPTGDAFFGPAGGSAGSCGSTVRSLVAEIHPDANTPAGTTDQVLNSYWAFYTTQIMQLGLNASRTQDLLLGPTNNLPCARIRYDAAVGSQVIVTRTAGNATGTAGVWTVESTGTHRAACLQFARGNKLVSTGASYYLPFRARISEIKAP